MSQRESGFARKERDLYITPSWVTEALLPQLPACKTIWEPAAACGKMVRVLVDAGYDVEASDIDMGIDFLAAPPRNVCAIVTNPPYNLATEFIEHALGIAPIVAMLLRTDFDHAKTRSHFFAGHPAFARKLVLTKRIRWFEDSKGSPSFNHCWMIWDWEHSGPPTISYGP